MKLLNKLSKMHLGLVVFILFAITWGPAYLLGIIEGTPGYQDSNLDYIITILYFTPFIVIIGFMIKKAIK